MYKLRFTPDFVRDFETIREDAMTVSGSTNVARKYLCCFFDKIKKKQQFPQSGTPVYYEDHFTGFYFVHFKAYNAFYVIRGEYIELVRALPSKSDYMKILFGDYYPEDIENESKTDHLNDNVEQQ